MPRLGCCGCWSASVDAYKRELATLIAVSTVGVLAFVLRSATVGSVVKALSSSPTLYRSLGADTRIPRLAAFLVGSAIAGIGGGIAGLEAGARPDIGEYLLLPSIVAAMLGLSWRFGFWGAVFALAVVRQTADWFVGQMWRDLLTMLVLLGILSTEVGRSMVARGGASLPVEDPSRGN